MRMRVEDIGDLEAEVFDPCFEFARIIPWIDHRAQAALFIANEIAKIPIASGIDLFKNHALLLHTEPPSGCEASSCGLSAMMSCSIAS